MIIIIIFSCNFFCYSSDMSDIIAAITGGEDYTAQQQQTSQHLMVTRYSNSRWWWWLLDEAVYIYVIRYVAICFYAQQEQTQVV
jgi:hypothetical protein